MTLQGLDGKLTTKTGGHVQQLASLNMAFLFIFCTD